MPYLVRWGSSPLVNESVEHIPGLVRGGSSPLVNESVDQNLPSVGKKTLHTWRGSGATTKGTESSYYQIWLMRTGVPYCLLTDCIAIKITLLLNFIESKTAGGSHWPLEHREGAPLPRRRRRRLRSWWQRSGKYSWCRWGSTPRLRKLRN